MPCAIACCATKRPHAATIGESLSKRRAVREDCFMRIYLKRTRKQHGRRMKDPRYIVSRSNQLDRVTASSEPRPSIAKGESHIDSVLIAIVEGLLTE